MLLKCILLCLQVIFHFLFFYQFLDRNINKENNHIAASLSYHHLNQNNLSLANTVSQFLCLLVVLTLLKLTELIAFSFWSLPPHFGVMNCLSVQLHASCGSDVGCSSVERSKQRSAIPPGSSPLQRLPRWRRDGVTRGSGSFASDDASRSWLCKTVSVSSLCLWSTQTWHTHAWASNGSFLLKITGKSQGETVVVVKREGRSKIC